MTRRTINEVPFGIWIEVLHLRKLVIDRPVHDRHFSCRAFRHLIVAREVFLYVTVCAGHAQSVAVSQVHDKQKPSSGNVLQYLDVLEYLLGRLLLMSRNLLRDLFYERIIRFLYRLLSGRCLWARSLLGDGGLRGCESRWNEAHNRTNEDRRMESIHQNPSCRVSASKQQPTSSSASQRGAALERVPSVSQASVSIWSVVRILCLNRRNSISVSQLQIAPFQRVIYAALWLRFGARFVRNWDGAFREWTAMCAVGPELSV
jgi:hypothetical protein